MNLVHLVGEQIKRNVLPLGHSEKDWRVLVIDHETAKLLYYSLPMSEILSRNIAMVERLEEARSANKEFSAIYFIRVNQQSIKRIEKDTANKLYKRVFVVSMSEISEKEKDLLEAVKKKVEKERKKNSKSELELHYKSVIFDFIPLSPDIFHIETSYSYYTQKSEYIEQIADKIRGVYRTLQIRCTPVPVGLYARRLSDKISSKGPGKIVILERGSDVNTPLLHTFTFESLLWDLELAGPGYLVESGGTSIRKKGAETETETESDETDEKRIDITEEYRVWESIRNKQLVDAHKALTELIQEETEAKEKTRKSNIKQLVRAVQKLPSQTRTLKEIKLLMNLLEKCVEFFNETGIKETAELEQGMAMGKDFKGNTFKHVVTKTFFSVLKTANLTQKEKYRLYLMYILNYGSFQANEERRLVEQGHLSQKDIEDGELAKKHLAGRIIKPITKRALPIARHVPLVADVLTAIIQKDEITCKKLEIDLPDKTDTLTGGSLRKREFVFKQSASGDSAHKRVIIVYFIGGVSIAEISEIREIAKNTGKTILVGSTDIYSPNTFTDGLRKL